MSKRVIVVEPRHLAERAHGATALPVCADATVIVATAHRVEEADVPNVIVTQHRVTL